MKRGGDVVTFRQQQVGRQLGAVKQRAGAEGLRANLAGQSQVLDEKDSLRHGDVGGQAGGAQAPEVGDDLQADDITYEDLNRFAVGVAFDPDAQ
ncbi:MAG: hypothetical protein VCF24_23380 [Candidatus Latescibacterota bacterium]